MEIWNSDKELKKKKKKILPYLVYSCLLVENKINKIQITIIVIIVE